MAVVLAGTVVPARVTAVTLAHVHQGLIIECLSQVIKRLPLSHEHTHNAIQGSEGT